MEDVRLFQVSSKDTGIKENEQRFLAILLGDKTSKACAAYVVPNFEPRMKVGAAATAAVRRRNLVMVLLREGIVVGWCI